MSVSRSDSFAFAKEEYLKDPAKATISLQATYENGSFVVPIGAAQKDFTVVEEVADATLNSSVTMKVGPKRRTRLK